MKNKKREYRNVLTGEIVSKRQRDKYMRAGLSNERAAEMNRVTNLDLALSAPARGRKSILKLEGEEKRIILEARKEELAIKKQRAKEEKAAKALEREIAKQRRKKVTRTRITKDLLRPGSKGARGKFNNYNEYLKSLSEAKALGVISDYALGMVGFDENSGEDRAITVFGLRDIRNKPYTEEVFEERMREEREERLYFVFQYYFIHLAYKESFYKEVNEKWIKAGRPSRDKWARTSRNRRR
ncbi:MAG TPA: hypothetical protein VJM50_21095 [Pyrinomonadaceae bacterium]|nr:hypothetical protein [Pyrinomonadaceae bacterium]